MIAAVPPPAVDLLHLTALRVAPAADAWLHRRPPARVLHVFDRAAYVVDGRGEVLLLAATPLGMGPFTLLADAPHGDLRQWVDVDEPALVRPEGLCVGQVVVRLDAVRSWRPSPDWRTVRRDASNLRPAVASLRRLLATGGRGSLFSALLDGRRGGADPKSFAGRLEESALAAAGGLPEGLARADNQAIAAAAEGLAGLGGGFTPAGDDYLLGTILALWAARPPGVAGVSPSRLAEIAAARTTRASAAWLRAAGRGEAAEPWHNLVRSIASGSQAEVAAAGRRLLHTGHTSGEDALIGFVCAVEALASAEVPSRPDTPAPT